MDDWNGTHYDDDPAQWQKLDAGVIHFENIEGSRTEQDARRIAEVRNPGFRSTRARLWLPGSGWRVELWKVRT